MHNSKPIVETTNEYTTDRDILRRALRFYRYCFSPVASAHGLQPYAVKLIRKNVYRLRHPEEECVEYSLLHRGRL